MKGNSVFSKMNASPFSASASASLYIISGMFIRYVIYKTNYFI